MDDADDDGLDADDPYAGGLATARRRVHDAARVVVLTGAGISTDSGIPDFRGPNGVWTRNPAAERLSTIDAYVDDADVRRLAWHSRVDSAMWSAEPNRGHRALVDLERQGRLHTLVTQNIDGLHQAAGTNPAKIVEIHGTMRDVVCLACGERNPAGPTLERVRDGDDDPRCRRPVSDATAGGSASSVTVCGGILKSATISFGQNLVPADLGRAEAAAEACDLLLAVGTTLGVYPAAGMVPLAARRGAAIVIVNAEPTPFDDLAVAVLRAPISDVLPALVAPAPRPRTPS
jgi:NAD-dependent deacetylase